MKLGRPAKFETAEALEAAIEAYFEKAQLAATITGLAYHLGFESRQSFYDYEEKGDFSYVIKRARLFIESCYEAKLSGNNPTGSIFVLKNMGWRDRQELDHTSAGEQIAGFIYTPPGGTNIETKE